MEKDNIPKDHNIDPSREDKVKNFKLDIKENEISSNVIKNTDLSANDIKSFSDEKINKTSEPDISREDIEKRKRISRRISKQNGCLFRMIWLVMVTLVAIIIAQYILVGVYDMLAMNRTEQTVPITIPKDSNITQVADILNENGIIENPTFFKFYAFFTKAHKSTLSGSFELKTNMDYEAIINHIRSQSNRTDIIELTFREGLNIIEYGTFLEQNGVCSSSDFLKACNSDKFDEDFSFISSIANASDRYYKLEGYLFPDTYKLYSHESPESIIKRFLVNYKRKTVNKTAIEGYNEKISIEDIAKQKNMSMNDVLVLASIIQAEAANTKDMYSVSSVFHNRLATISTGGVNKYKEGGLFCLGADSTVWYPYRTKASVPSDKATTFKSTYDTYTIKGLPAGPICNPGLDAIDAALNPSATEYFYFCHSSNGTAYYAKTMPEHQRNLAKAGL